MERVSLISYLSAHIVNSVFTEQQTNGCSHALVIKSTENPFPERKIERTAGSPA